MKKRLFEGLAVVLALALLSGAALADVRTTGNVWLRTGPGLNFDTVTSFSEGKTLEFLGETSEDDRGVTWYKVSSGDYTGWVSSRYTELTGESGAAAKSTAEPTAEPTVEPSPTEALPVSLPALNAGRLFVDSVPGDEEDPQDTPSPAPAPEPAQTVELSSYYLGDLVDSANQLGLISYRQVESEAPYQYYNDAMILAGNRLVENIVVYGAGYEVYGVSVGMDLSAARACLNAAGLDYVASMNSVTYEHKATEGSLFRDENGHDSCVNLWLDEDDIVTEIDWSSYTG